MRRFVLAWMLPPVLLAVLALGPVLVGSETFFLRDVFGAHLELRGALDAGLAGEGSVVAGTGEERIGTGGGAAESTERAALPMVDPYRGGGQALLGNPNAVPLHPSTLLHRVLPFFPAFNLHLALHLLLAPFGVYWLARELGLERRAAWVAGVAWGFSGYMASQLLFYNLVGGVVAAPALAAAAVRLVRRRREGAPAAGSVAAVGALWAMLLLAGDPMIAAAAGAAALGLGLAESRGAARGSEGAEGPAASDTPSSRRRPRHGVAVGAPLVVLVGAFAAGTLLALPQLLPFLALLPASARAAGFASATQLAGSFDPRQAVEWLLPFAFGRPDLLGPGGFWGYRFYQGSWAFHVTLYPGLAALALLWVAGRCWRRPDALGRVGRRGVLLVLAGLFVALGAFNPLLGPLLGLPGMDLLRYPVKLWLWVAMGASLLCGVGWARLEAGDDVARRRFAGALLVLAGLLAAVALACLYVPWMTGLLHAAMPPGAPREMAAAEATRWAGLAGTSALAAVALSLLAVPGKRSLMARRPALAGALLVTLHAALQLYFLAPAFATEPVAVYRQPPVVWRTLPPGEPIVQGSLEGLFGGAAVESGQLPVPEVRWVYRRAFAEGYPLFGPLMGRRFDLNVSPEGLDTAELRLAIAAVRSAPDDATRVRLLEAWGLGRLILHRELEVEGGAGRPGANAPGPTADDDGETIPEGAPPPLLAAPTPAPGPETLGSAGADGAAETADVPSAAPPAGAVTEGPRNVPRGTAELLATLPSVDRRVRVYRLPGAAPEVYLATGLVRLREGAPPLAAAAALGDPRFRPGRDAVLAAPGRPTPGGAPGELEVVSRGPEHLEAETSSTVPGVLVWQRSRLPFHRATVDGEAVEPLTVNLYRVGVPVPPGQHRVRIKVDRGSLRTGQAGAAAGLLLLLVLAIAARRRR